MKIHLRQYFLLGLMLVTALFSLVSTSVFAVANDSAFLAPASGTTQIGSTLTIDVNGHLGGYWWGGGPTSANGTLTFPANLLQVTSIDKTGTTFPNVTASFDNAAGTVTYSETTNAFSYTPAWSDAHLLRINFQAIASGTAPVQFSSMSYSTGSSGGTTGGSYTIASPPPVVTPTPTPKPSTIPKPSLTPKPSVSTTPTPAATPSVEETPAPTTNSDGGLSITNVAVKTTRQKNSIAWTLNNPGATPTFTYGTVKATQKTDAPSTKLDDGSYEVDLSNLKPGTLYYFTIKATTPDNLQGAVYDGTLTTRGYPVQLTIQQNGILAANAKVKIGERNFVANKDAIITTELPDGAQTASITVAGSTTPYSAQFTVEKKTIPATGNPELQSFTLNVVSASGSTTSHMNILVIILGGVGATILVIGSITGFLLYRHRQNQPSDGSFADSDLLSASYGTALENAGTQTPEPNLEAHATVAAEGSPEIMTGEMPAPTAPLLVEASDQGVAPALVPTGEQPTSNSQPYDQAPGTTEAAPLADASLIEMPIDEQLSAPVTSVESIEEVPDAPVDQAASTAEQAIYHPETGELDIIHNHDPLPIADASRPPLTPAQSSTIQPGGTS